MFNMNWEAIKRILFVVDKSSLSQREKEVSVKIASIGMALAILILVLIFLIAGVFNIRSNNWGDLFYLAILLFLVFVLLKAAFNKNRDSWLIKIFSAVIILLFVLAYNPAVSGLGWGLFLILLASLVQTAFRSNSTSNNEEILSENKPRNSFFSSLPRDSKWNKNLGFKGFLLAGLFFVAIMIFVCLFPYLTDLIRR